VDHVGFIPYTGKEPDGEFFYKAEIQLKITHDGRRYFEELQLKGTEARSKITAYLDTNIVSRLAKTLHPFRQPLPASWNCSTNRSWSWSLRI